MIEYYTYLNYDKYWHMKALSIKSSCFAQYNDYIQEGNYDQSNVRSKWKAGQVFKRS